MAGFALDTSCMVAVVCSWHDHHDRAAMELTRRLAARQSCIVPAPALIETYAVLTRLPPPHRLSPSDARRLIEANYTGTARVIALEPNEYLAVLQGAPDDGVAGGRTYDAIIARCAVKGRASALLTFNERHFTALGTALEIVVP